MDARRLRDNEFDDSLPARREYDRHDAIIPMREEVNIISAAVLSSGNALIDELELVTMPVQWSADGGGVEHPDFAWSFSVTVTLTASVSVTFSW